MRKRAHANVDRVRLHRDACAVGGRLFGHVVERSFLEPVLDDGDFGLRRAQQNQQTEQEAS